MKQILFDRFGVPAHVAGCQNVAAPPAPKPWEVSVDILAAPVNPSDIAVLRGQYGMLPARLPATAGMEACGIVTATGSEVSGVAEGDRVLMIANDNWCQRRTLPALMVMPVPDALDSVAASMVKVNSLSAYLMLRDGGDLQPGDCLIQSAPLSAVGRMVIGMARAMGLQTVNIVRRPEAEAEIRALGGDFVLVDGDDLPARVREATGNTPVMLGLDGVAGEQVMRLAGCLEDGAPLINYGMLSGQPCQILPSETIFRDIRLRGFWLAKLLNRMSAAQRVEALRGCIELLLGHGLTNQIDRTYRLEQIADAIGRAESPDRHGKVVLLPNGEPA
ncbi:zinc-dependent alcohol dehydrogenase family protein [Paracoccus sp. (in: a-proteobacteria)]|uniref:zinc-dependent alcohol dehydrogenase family protein n=1 Tax=Paracoccus sp. TaxID=267 RepID=UPI003A87D49F